MDKSEEGFKFNLKQGVRLIHSDEQGVVIGRAQYNTSENSYLVRYQAGDGRQVEQWWGESSLDGAFETEED